MGLEVRKILGDQQSNRRRTDDFFLLIVDANQFHGVTLMNPETAASAADNQTRQVLSRQVLYCFKVHPTL